MATKPEMTDHDDLREIVADDDAITDPTFARPSDDEVPVEPRALAEGQADETEESEAVDTTRTLRDLLGFHLYGRRPKGVSASDGLPSIPALLYRYRDLSRVRHDYPVCLNGVDPGESAKTLSQIVDDILADVVEEGDTGEQMRRDIYRLESVMRSVTEREPGQRLSVVWDLAATSLMSTLKLSGEKKDRLEQHLSTARDALQIDGDLVSCSPYTASRVFTTLMMVDWRERTESWSDELAALIRNLNDILLVDDQYSDDAMSPEHLSDSLGTGEGDFDAAAMSTILSNSPHADRLPEARRQRVQKALSVLSGMSPIFDPSGENAGDAPFKVRDVVTDCTTALQEHERRMQLMVEFFGSVRIARLETSNGYREAVHDPFFEQFDMTYLTEEELRLCPPVLVRLTREELTGNEIESLFNILGLGLPVKVLLTLDDLCGIADEPSVAVGWGARLSSAVMALNDIYVLQAPLANFSAIRSGLLAGFHYDGPAFCSIYTGDRQTPDGYGTYLAAAAATESRSFPIFVFNPERGDTLAERMDVSGNPQSELDWPIDSFRYRTSDDEEKTADLKFTSADFFFFDPRLKRHFWSIAPAKWHDDMMPLSDYIELSPEEASTKIPYLLAVDERRQLTRVVMTREVVSEVLRRRAFWRNLQESGGINNSFAINLVAQEKERLEEEKRQEIDAIEQRYVAQLEQDIGELTREIIQRIAGQLILGKGTDTPMTTPLAPLAVPTKSERPVEGVDMNAAEDTTAVVELEEELEDEEQLGGLDDPYIDTPLCTTCNECTQLNGRMFVYNDNKQAIIQDAAAGTFKDLVLAAERCPVHIIHPGKPRNTSEADLDDWIKRAAPFS